MDSPHKMDVVDWRDSAPPVAIKRNASPSTLSPTLIGILGTLLLHALIIPSVPWSTGPTVKPRTQVSLAAALARTKTDSAEDLMLISLPAMAVTNQLSAQSFVLSVPDLKKMKIKPAVDAVDPPVQSNIETLALSEEAAAKPMGAGGDAAELARLFGIYTGQIQARIDRIWRRPRSPVNEDAAEVKPADSEESFQCEAQVVQDVRGNVQEILLPRCNGSAAWQRSLVVAIQQASPLPAPPSTKVFTQSITLRFVGLPYAEGASSDEYEIIPVARVDK
jgi:TonB C terminal